MKRFQGAAAVAGGYYMNTREWKLEVVEGDSGRLPEGGAYVRIPVLLMIVLAPLMGLAFVILIPFFGLAVLIEQGWRKAAHAVTAWRHARQARRIDAARLH